MSQRHPRRHWSVAAAVLTAMLAFPGTGLAQDYHPLDVGSRWEHYSLTQGHQTTTITGDFLLLGSLTRIRHQDLEGEVWENYWSRDPDGDLYIHGAKSISLEFELAYVPPIKMVDAPLFLGKTWTTPDIHTYYFDGTPTGDEPFEYPLRVYSEGAIEVPAGIFYAYGVGYDSGPVPAFVTPQGTFDIFGRHCVGMRTREDNASEWYAVDVGLVQFGVSDPQYAFQLLSYELPPVPALPTTWGAIKALFRPGLATSDNREP